MDKSVRKKIDDWLAGDYDLATKNEILRLEKENPEELVDAFYQNLEFGTGGLRGIMGVGTNRMNKYTVAKATQGLANYLRDTFPDDLIKVAIAYDSRNNSSYFADIATDVLTANGIICCLFEELRPTPELSFAVRELNCLAGIVITASHNPKEYNGYKVYWRDGGQLVPPHDHNVINEVNQIKSIDHIKWNRIPTYVEMIGKEFDDIYLKKIRSLSFRNDRKQQPYDLKIVYTPLHGTGITLIPNALKSFGFPNVSIVEKQAHPDGDFPTAPYPNPEEKSTLMMALEQAEKEGADLVLATDPDADRVGIAVRNTQNELVLLNGNHLAALLTYYIVSEKSKKNELRNNQFVVKTIVTTDLIHDIAKDYNISCYNVLTGFKYIAEKIKELEGEQQFLCGGEESYGFLTGDFVRDKDAVSTCCMMAELTSWALSKGETVVELLEKLFSVYTFYKDAQISLTKKGQSGSEEIKKMMTEFRTTPPKSIGKSKVVRIVDYLTKKDLSFYDDIIETETDLPISDVIQFYMEDHSLLTVRPSGTEPKIKFYISVKEKIDKENIDQVEKELDNRIEEIKKSLLI